MAAQVEGDGPPAVSGQDLRRIAPGVARLAAAMHEEHGPVAIVAPHVGDQVDALEAFEPHRPRIHGRDDTVRRRASASVAGADQTDFNVS